MSDLMGQTFGRLKVIEKVGASSKREILWKCSCECGNTKVTTGCRLRSRVTQSCGCFRREVTAVRSTKHGFGINKPPTYKSWQNMLNRCRNPKRHAYEHYGGRGIKVCPRWTEYANFLQDMGERPGGTSIDRIDPNGNYEPSNCRWATQSEQVRNRRRA